MPFNLLALCKNTDGYVVRRIPLSSTTQTMVHNIFNNQKSIFLQGKEETAFSGDWKPDDDEILTISLPEEAQIIIDTYNDGNLLLVPTLDLSEYENLPIKALFGSDDNGHTIMVQKFSQSQYLSRRFSLFLDNSVYNKLDTPLITLDNKLLCVISNNIVKFNSFSNMRCVFDMKNYYQIATNEDIDTFSTHSSVYIEDIENLKNIANQNIRKRIHNLLKSNILDDFSATDILNKAQEQGFNDLISIREGKVYLPNDAKTIIKILCFLDEKLYKGVFSNLVIMANSTKTAD